MWKVDFHVHTTASSCYLDYVMPELCGKTLPQDIVHAALAAGLQAIAITDHNTAEGIEPMREAARDEKLCLFPGIEISAKGGHLLALFEPDVEVEKLQYLLHYLGFQEEHQGKGYMETDYWLDEVFAKVEEAGGLAIAAHVDRKPRGFIASEEDLKDKLRIYHSPYLSALEITIPQNKSPWNKGEMSGYSRKIACVQGSDAHAPNEVGRRPVYLDIPRLELSGLRLAFLELGVRIRLPEEIERETSLCGKLAGESFLSE